MESELRSRDGSIHVTDERFNAASHLAAALFAVVGTGLLVAQASVQGNPWKTVALSVYGLSLITLFTASALHHGIDRGPRVNEILRTIDYDSVFFLIAGTATPLVLVLFRNTYGWTVRGGEAQPTARLLRLPRAVARPGGRRCAPALHVDLLLRAPGLGPGRSVLRTPDGHEAPYQYVAVSYTHLRAHETG